VLFERDGLLATLASFLTDAGQGHGRLVLVSGEAGVGKSSLVQRLADTAEGSRVLVGVCDGAVPPRPCGPVVDIADAVGINFVQGLPAPSDRLELFRQVRGGLVVEPTMFVIEDLHWADEATLDLVRYLGRRLHEQPLLMVVTYRDEGIDALTAVLGDLSSCATTTRLEIPPLSVEAVQEWVASAGSLLDAVALHDRTGGNPFFIGEVLSSGGHILPAGLRDTVLARTMRLSTDARAALAAVAVVGPAIADLVLAAAGVPAVALDDCLRTGFISTDGHQVRFRHDLIREVVASSLCPADRSRLATGALGWLQQHVETDDRRLATLAEIAGAADAVLAHAPRAAQRAGELGAHGEAVRHLRAAARYRSRLSHPLQARLLADLSYECYLTDRPEEALECRQLALELFRSEGEVTEIGQSLRWISRLSWMLGRTTDAHDFAAQAVAALQALPPGKEQAMAYSNRSQLSMLAGDVAGASEWGQRAIDLGTELSADDVVMHAKNNVGAAVGCSGQLSAGVRLLEASLELALRNDAQEHVARSYTNLASICVSNYALEAAAEYLDAGVAYCAERDMDLWQLSLESEAAAADLATGRWNGALARCDRMLRNPRGSAVNRVTALWVRGIVEMRRGSPGASAHLAEAHTLATRLQDPQSRIPVASARAEAGWTSGKFSSANTEIDRIWPLAVRTGQRWWLGELAWWSVLAGHRLTGLPATSEPHELMLAGQWRPAARAWDRLGNPFWRALCLAESDDPDDARAAHALLTSLGATATLQAATREWQRRRVPVPRGPRLLGSLNGHGLTARELDVVDLLDRGLSNAEIAEQLVVSERTVAHHVSAILRKLHARSRAQAVAISRRLGILSGVGQRAE